MLWPVTSEGARTNSCCHFSRTILQWAWVKCMHISLFVTSDKSYATSTDGIRKSCNFVSGDSLSQIYSRFEPDLSSGLCKSWEAVKTFLLFWEINTRDETHGKCCCSVFRNSCTESVYYSKVYLLQKDFENFKGHQILMKRLDWRILVDASVPVIQRKTRRKSPIVFGILFWNYK